MIKLAIIGTRGIPASYSGFETSVEETAIRFVELNCDTTVYCRLNYYKIRPKTYKGVNLVHLPSIKTKYYSRSNYRQLFKQYFNYGFYKVRGIQKRKRLFSIRHLVPSTFLISLIGTSIFGYLLHLPLISFSVIFLYLIVNFISSIIVSQKVFQIPLIFLSFWILHLGYGLGFIWGLIRFAGKWRDNSLKDDHFNREQFIANGGVSI